MIQIQRPEKKQKRADNASLVLEGVLFNIRQWQQKMYDGSTKTFEAAQRPDTVLILPVLDDGNILFTKEEQPGMKVMLRTIGGRVEKGESAEDAARRELLEETGYNARELRLWDTWQPLNKTDWAIYLFVAHGLEQTGITHQDSGEKMNLITYPIESILDGNMDITFDDNEFLFKLYHAQANDKERARVMSLLKP